MQKAEPLRYLALRTRGGIAHAIVAISEESFYTSVIHLKHIEFRQCFGLDTILDDWKPPEVLSMFTPGGFFGEDRQGHPVWFDCMGNLDFRGM